MYYPKQTDNYDVDIFNSNFKELAGKSMDIDQKLSTEIDRATNREDSIESGFTAEAKAIRQLVDTAYESANGYTNEKISQLINGAPSTLDTLKEIADALEKNADVVNALNEAIGKKANEAEFDSHVKDKNNPHGVTASQIGITLATAKKAGLVKPDGATTEVDENGTLHVIGNEGADIKDKIVTFDSEDELNPKSPVDMPVIITGQKISALVRSFSLGIKNIRYLLKLMGNVNLSSIGDGTITGAINELNTGLAKIGTLVVGKVVTTTVPVNTGVVIATITLPPGRWIMLADVWLPETSMVRLEFRGITGVLGQFNHPQIVGIANTAVQFVVEIVCTHWASQDLTVVQPSVVAIRIS